MSNRLVVHAEVGEPYIVTETTKTEIIYHLHIPLKVESEFKEK